MIDPSHGKSFRNLGVKPGDWVRLVADCSMHGVEIQVPPENVSHIKADSFGSWVQIAARDGRLYADVVPRYGAGDTDLWIQVFRG